MHDASLCMMILEKAIQCLGYIGTCVDLLMLRHMVMLLLSLLIEEGLVGEVEVDDMVIVA